MSKDILYDVSDPTDFLETPLPSFAAVDSALRCQVCKDFYTTPMITSCSHTFCSLCIRRSLNNDGRCPLCRTKDQEMKLRVNSAMEDLVEAYRLSRPEILEYLKRPAQIARQVSPKRQRVEVEAGEKDSPLRKRTRSSGRTKQNVPDVTVIDSDGDEDYAPEEEPIKCPICQDKFPTEQAVQMHIDQCDGEPPSKKRNTKSSGTFGILSNSSNPIRKLSRLPQLHYSMVKDAALRKKLSDLGISNGGTRQLMERRYTEWVTLWNANCDSKKPKAPNELRRELDTWERTQGGRPQTFSGAQNSGANLKDKDFDGATWSTQHNDSFKQLIADAKRKSVALLEKARSGTSASNMEENGESAPSIPPEYPDSKHDALPIASNHQEQPSLNKDIYSGRLLSNAAQTEEDNGIAVSTSNIEPNGFESRGVEDQIPHLSFDNSYPRLSSQYQMPSRFDENPERGLLPEDLNSHSAFAPSQ